MNLHPKKIISGTAFILFLFSVSFAQAETWQIVVPSEGHSELARRKITKQVIEIWKKRLANTKFVGIDFRLQSTTRVAISFGRKIPKDALKAILTTPGRLEIRPLVNGVEIFDALTNPHFLKTQNEGVKSVCFKSRKELQRTLRSFIGPDFHFGVYRTDIQLKAKNPWCIVALGESILGNKDILKAIPRRSLKGDWSLLLKLRPESVDSLAENGELKVKSLALTMDGDIISRTTLNQLRRLPISVRPPSDTNAKRWTRILHALVDQPLLVPVVLLEPK